MAVTFPQTEAALGGAVRAASHPLDALLRADRLPHIWCPGCGLGTITACFGQALLESGVPLDRHAIVSGIGCTGRTAGYVDIDSFHTNHGRAIPFAIGLKLGRPEMCVTVFSGDGDLFAIGGNHFIHAARRNMDIHVICVNNFNYGMTGGQAGPTTPPGARTTTTPGGYNELPFNLPQLAASAGAVYVARWSALHVRQLRRSMLHALKTPGFTFIEVLAPCPIGFGRHNDLGEGLDEMQFYREQCTVDPYVPLAEMHLSMHKESPLVCGEFVDVERPLYRPPAPAQEARR
ncbi:MAG TPA: thiamine pyrophosphate-dependent enzyme [Chloroflexota bacterium]|nr:thiamine pyrophosphate-dependent enzyme [Chloroflexota bacterium]